MKKRRKKLFVLFGIVLAILLLIIGIIYFIIVQLNNKKIETITLQVNKYVAQIEKLATEEEPNIINKRLDQEVELDEEEISIISEDNEKPLSGYYKIDENGKVTNSCFIVTNKKNNYKVLTIKDDLTINRTSTDCYDVDLNVRDITKKDGTVIYFNPETGKKCSESDYKNNEHASTTTNNTGCMRWYVFLDETGKDTVNLLLDHNTTALVAFNESGNNVYGPSENRVLKQLKNASKDWNGVKDRTDSYTYGGSNSYTIDYTGYKARLITAEEVAKISGNTSFDIASSSERFYFGTNKSDDYSLRREYTWLYATMGGCSTLCINPDSNTYQELDGPARSIIFGYWTSSSLANSNDKAWLVYNKGELYYSHVRADARYGVRPVITVKKAKIY